jgi:hypothetical protein
MKLEEKSRKQNNDSMQTKSETKKDTISSSQKSQDRYRGIDRTSVLLTHE